MQEAREVPQYVKNSDCPHLVAAQCGQTNFPYLSRLGVFRNQELGELAEVVQGECYKISGADQSGISCKFQDMLVVTNNKVPIGYSMIHLGSVWSVH